jgi:hypothetical protein
MDHLVKQAIEDLICSAVFFRTYYTLNNDKLSLFANRYLNQMQGAISVLEDHGVLSTIPPKPDELKPETYTRGNWKEKHNL